MDQALADLRRIGVAAERQRPVQLGQPPLYLRRELRREAGRASSRPSGVAWVSISNAATCLRLTPTGQEHSPSKQLELGQVSRDYKDHLRVRTANLDDLRAALPTEAVLIEFRQFQRVDFRSGASGEPRVAALLLDGFDEPVVADVGPVVEVREPVAALLAGSLAA